MSPYSDAVNERAAGYFRDKHGLHAIAREGFGATDAYAIGQLGPQHARHRHFFRRHDVDFELARPEGCRDFEPDETRPQHDRTPCGLRPLDDRATISERAQGMHVRLVGAGDREAHGLGARRQ